MAIYKKNGDSIAVVYDAGGNLISQAYDINENPLLSGVDYSQYTVSAYCSVSDIGQMQGFDIYNGTIFQFIASTSVSNVMCTIDADTSTVIQNGITAISEHGDSASFSNEKYTESDSVPLLYVTADANPAKVYVNRVTTTTSELIKTLYFPLAQTGYYAAHAYDENNSIMYMIGYTEQNYLTDNNGSNKTLVSKWDMSQLTQNQDGTYTPSYVDSYEIPFIYCTQGQQYHDGMIWVASGYVGASQSYIYALNPVDGTLLYTIDLDTTTEVEGLSFISNTEMVVGLSGGLYQKYTFAEGGLS